VDETTKGSKQALKREKGGSEQAIKQSDGWTGPGGSSLGISDSISEEAWLSELRLVAPNPAGNMLDKMPEQIIADCPFLASDPF
jgi:hypothetical protein